MDSAAYSKKYAGLADWEEALLYQDWSNQNPVYAATVHAHSLHPLARLDN